MTCGVRRPKPTPSAKQLTIAAPGKGLRDRMRSSDGAVTHNSLWVWAKGPISDPALLNAALRRALVVVKSGRPALVDAVCQPR